MVKLSNLSESLRRIVSPEPLILKAGDLERCAPLEVRRNSYRSGYAHACQHAANQIDAITSSLKEQIETKSYAELDGTRVITLDDIFALLTTTEPRDGDERICPICEDKHKQKYQADAKTWKHIDNWRK